MSDNQEFNPSNYESKWEERWLNDKLYKTGEDRSKEKFYSLYSFPYPSGAGLHVGHVEGMVANDIVARYYRMKGRNVTLPMGWDSFGLPAENYAIKTGTPPEKSTEEAVKTFISQINNIGISVDWDKEVGAHRPDYYRWTQWIFLQLYKNGLAYKKKAPVNWCPKDQTVLANEQVIDGRCERCDSIVEQKDMDQWFFKITDFAERLDKDLDKVDWPESTKAQQRNWIGKSVGAEIVWDLENPENSEELKIHTFTTRFDTIPGPTFMVVAPEYSNISKLITSENKEACEKYIEEAKNKTDLERQSNKDKTGVFTGSYAINPYNNEKVPIYIADYVLANYGTGAVMGMPGHDQRDWEFATKYNLPIKYSMKPKEGEIPEGGYYEGEGYEINSGEFDGLWWTEARDKIIEKLEKEGKAIRKTNYKLRDWLVSRQRYWGCPIPIVYDPEGNPHPLNESDLPLLLPTDVDFLPTGQSPITTSESFKKLAEEKYGEGWHFEYDTMDTFVDSSWYFFRFLDVDNQNQIFETPSVKLAEVKSENNQRILEVAKSVMNLLSENKVKNVLFGSLAISLLNRAFVKDHNDIDIIVEKEKHDYSKELLEKNGYIFKETKQFDRNKKYIFEKDGVEVELLDSFDGITFDFNSNHLVSEINGKIFEIAPLILLIKLYEWKDNAEYIEFLKDYLTSQNYWLPTDLYMIGAEHTVLHLLYSRFFTKFFFDQGLINFDEPFYKMRHMGTILGPDGRKMSKRWGNVINPDDEIKKFGADAVRMYEMFMGPIDEPKPWNDKAESGVFRFLNKVWNQQSKVKDLENTKQSSEVNKLVKKVSEDIEELSFNTSVAKFMEFVNFLTKESEISNEVWQKFLLLLAPFAPFITEELWNRLGNEYTIHTQNWPEYNQNIETQESVKIAVQISGKVRAVIDMPFDSEEAEVKTSAMNNEKVKKYLTSQPKKVIYVKNRVINFIL